MARFDAQFRCSIGGSDLQLADYSFHSEAVVANGVEIGRKLSVEAEGWVDGSSGGDLATRLAGAVGSLVVSGQVFQIFALGGAKEVEILPARCKGDGPHVKVSVDKQGGGAALHKMLRITLEANVVEGDGTPLWAEKVKTVTSPDGMRVCTRSGAMSGVGVSAYFLGTRMPALIGVYPANKWVLKYEMETDPTDTDMTYLVTCEELLEPLPDGGPAAATTVDCDYSTNYDDDENGRRMETWNFEVLLKAGDPWSLLSTLRRWPAGESLRERVDITGQKQLKMRCMFSRLASQGENVQRDDNGDVTAELLNFEQSVEVPKEVEIVSLVEYDGGTPDLLWKKTGFTATQTGRAVGIGKFPNAPEPIFTHLAEPPRVSRRYVNKVEREITWSYSFVDTSAAAFTLDDQKIKGMCSRATAAW